MKRTLLLTALLAAAPTLQAASADLRYGFRDGATYQVKQQYHNVGNSVTTMNMMGQQQTMETPINHVNKSSWSATAARNGNSVTFKVNYGRQEGGERWGDPSGNSGAKMFADSSATVTFDLQDGMTSMKTDPPDDPIVDIIYRYRFGWMPALPQKPLKVGDSFIHDYTLQGGMTSMKGEDEYVLEEISGNFAYFYVETRSVMVYDYSKLYQQQEGMPQGMSGMMGNMTVAHKGEGTATFNLKEGIFVEREMETAYTTRKAETPGMMINSMRGTTRERWEMERR